MKRHRLILIKHARPLIDPTKPPEQWRLSEQGRALCVPLAAALAPFGLGAIVASEEPKARETAEIVAEKLQIPHQTAASLHEHDRSNVPHLRSGEFISMMELMLRKPEELVLGRETASAALARFEKAVQEICQAHGAQNIGVVSHGTVLALYLSARGAGTAFELWRRLGLPSFAVIDLPEMNIAQIVESIQLDEPA
jgi:broad specificity phosphatase PhoE